MSPAGLKEVEAAKTDGLLENAYGSPGKMTIRDDFMKEISNEQRGKIPFRNTEQVELIFYCLASSSRQETGDETKAHEDDA